MTICLRDLIELSLDGEWGSSEASEATEPMLCIRGTDFDAARAGDLSRIPLRHIPEAKARRKRLQPWDVVIEVAGGTKNQPTGRTLLVRPGLLTASLVGVTCASFSRFIRLRRDLCHPEFVFWYLQNLYAMGAMHAYHTQHTGVARFQWTTFAEREPLELPGRLLQERVADILCAYDDLIENCERRIRVLNEMACSLYREWFVLFFYPGHEKVPLVDSAIGAIPRGWTLVHFTDLADVLSGGTPKTQVAKYWNGSVPFFTPRDVTDWIFVLETGKTLTQLGLSNCASPLYAPETVFITARGTVGKVAMAAVPMAMNQSCYALIGKAGVSQRFLFLLTLQHVETLRKNAGGATFDTIVVDTFRRLRVVRPPGELIALFTRAVSGIFDAIRNAQQQVTTLRRTRDLLLPRLLSGHLDPGVAA